MQFIDDQDYREGRKMLWFYVFWAAIAAAECVGFFVLIKNFFR